MKLKMRDGHAVVKDGKPVYVHDDGSEEAFDAPAAMTLARGQAFAASKFVTDKLSIHHDVAAAFFGSALRLEKGQLVAYGPGGVPLYSHKRHGELASFDEALEQMVAKYPNRDMILRKDGGDAPSGAGQQPTGARITRTQFDALPQGGRAKFLKQGGRVGDGAAPPAVSPSAAGTKAMQRAQFDAQTPAARMAFMKSGGAIVD